MSAPSPVLITWVAINNDPYERVFKSPDYRLVDGAAVPGPTLTLLCDEESKYAGVVRDVVLLHRQPTGPSAEREQRAPFFALLGAGVSLRTCRTRACPEGGS